MSKSTEFEFKSIHLYRLSSTMTGSIEFVNKDAKIELKVNDELGRQLLALCADSIEDTASQLAEQLRLSTSKEL